MKIFSGKRDLRTNAMVACYVRLSKALNAARIQLLSATLPVGKGASCVSIVVFLNRLKPKRNTHEWLHLSSSLRVTIPDRSTIDKQNLSQTKIAAVVGSHKSTISRELKSHRGLLGFRPKQAQCLS